MPTAESTRLVLSASLYGGIHFQDGDLRGRDLGRNVGRLYAANTFGGVLGAVAGGYLLIPCMGTQPGIVVLSALLALTGAALVLARAQGFDPSWPPVTAPKVVLAGRQIATSVASSATAWLTPPPDP